MFRLFIMLKGKIRNRNDFFRIRPAQHVRVVTRSGCGPTLGLLRMWSSFCIYCTCGIIKGKIESNFFFEYTAAEELQANRVWTKEMTTYLTQRFCENKIEVVSIFTLHWFISLCYWWSVYLHWNEDMKTCGQICEPGFVYTYVHIM
jgi:hypothetical protein